MRLCVISAWILLLLTAPLPARTITLTAEDCDQMAAISSQAPRLSWAITQPGPGVFNTQPDLQWNSNIAVLLRFPFTEKIPTGQRITKADLTLNPSYLAGAPELHVRRILAEWGTGVCHQYRMMYPQKLEWTQPGGRGAATDCHTRSSAVFKFAKVVEHTVDLTEDVELWYTGAATNRGWILTIENPGTHVYLPSPYSPITGGSKHWKLQITFEPK
jgi:hypothetical protein